MRFLIDNNLPPALALELQALGHDAVHVRELGLSSAPDRTIFDRAAADKRAIIAQDADFSALLACREVSEPSVILFRRRFKSLASVIKLLRQNLSALEPELLAGAMVVITDSRIRARRLPFNAPIGSE